MDSNSFYNVISDISVLSILPPLVMAVSCYRVSSIPVKIFSYLIFFSTISEFVSLILAKNNINNLPELHLFTIIEASLLLVFFYVLFTNTIVKRTILVVLVLFVISDVVYMLTAGNIWMFNTLFRTIESFILTIAGLGYFYHKLNSHSNIPLEKRPTFWLNSGLLLYFMGNCFLFMLYNVILSKSHEWNQNMWVIHSGLNIASNILYTVGFICSKRTAK